MYRFCPRGVSRKMHMNWDFFARRRPSNLGASAPFDHERNISENGAHACSSGSNLS